MIDTLNNAFILGLYQKCAKEVIQLTKCLFKLTECPYMTKMAQKDENI